MYTPYEKDDGIEYDTWIAEMTVPVLDEARVPTTDNRRLFWLPTATGQQQCLLDLSTISMVIVSNCEVDEQGYPILPTRAMSKGILRTESGNGRIIHPLLNPIVQMVTC